MREAGSPTTFLKYDSRAGPGDVVAGGGGTESRSLEPSGESREGGYERGDEPPIIRGGSGGHPRNSFQNLCI